MFHAYGLYSHIRANRLRTIFLLAGFVALLLALMFSFALIFEARQAPYGADFPTIAAQAAQGETARAAAAAVAPVPPADAAGRPAAARAQHRRCQVTSS